MSENYSYDLYGTTVEVTCLVKDFAEGHKPPPEMALKELPVESATFVFSGQPLLVRATTKGE